MNEDAQPQVEETCRHPELRFKQGGAVLFCVTCRQPWYATNAAEATRCGLGEKDVRVDAVFQRTGED